MGTHPRRVGGALLAVAAVATALLSGCAPEPTNGPGASDRVCVVLPDDDPAGRWERSDRPALVQGVEAAGLEIAVASADGAPAGLSEAVSAQLDDGCGVLVLVDVDDAAADVAANAAAEGVPVIAYDGAFAGASYIVAFDEAEAGRLQGQSLVDALAAAGRDPAAASVVYLTDTDLDDAEREGALTALRAGGVRPAAEPVAREGETPDAAFSRALAGLSGVVDGVWAPEEAAAAGAVAVLADRGHAPVPLSGGPVTDEALRRILAGWQTSGVLLPTDLEAQAVVAIAVAVLQPPDGSTPAPSDEVQTTLVPPRLVTAAEIAGLVADGLADASTLCAGEVGGVVLAEKCAAAGIG